MWQSLVLSVTEATLSTEQLAAGLIVGDPMLQVFWQLRGLYLQGDRKLRPQRASRCSALSERHRKGASSQAAALCPLDLCFIADHSL